MAVVQQSIKNLKGGISQQPDTLRYPDQGTQQINGWTSETTGLQKRPPITYTKQLAKKGEFGDRPYIHMINRDATEQYDVIFTGKSIKIYDLKGNPRTVKGDLSYVTTANPRDDLRMVTVADYTFIINRKVICKEGTALHNGGTYKPRGRALVNVRGGQYGRELSIAINGTWADVVVLPDGREPEHSKSMDSVSIANKLKVNLDKKFPTFTTEVNPEGVIIITAPAGTDITKIETRDGYNNQLINGIISTVQTFNKLPATAPDGYIVEIVNDPTQSSDSYFVMYNAEKKAWKECPEWNLKKGLDAKTLCHALRRDEDGNFSLVLLDWNDRVCGDDDSNPMPSFVGGTINDVFFYRNRLGFLSGENVILSRTGRFYNFFPQSVATLSDDDPIDVAVSHNRISILQYAVPFSDELLLWSDESQFTLTSAGILSSKTVELNLTSEFDVSGKARPFSMGRGVYFASPRANHTSIKRYYAVQDVSDVKDAEDISSHIPKYIPNGVYSIQGSGTENFVGILSEGATHQLFIYKFYYSESNLMIQSWSHWDFGEGIKCLAASCIGSTLYLIFESSDAIWLGQLDFTGNTVDFVDVEKYRVHVDHKKVITLGGTYDINHNVTTVKYEQLYPHGISNRPVLFVDTRGVFYKFDGNSKVFEFTGDRRTHKFVVGFELPFKYEFSKFLIKKMAEDGSVATEDSGRLQLQRAWVTYEQSGAFQVEVFGRSHEPNVYTMSGATLGDQSERLGNISLWSGLFKWSIGGEAINSRSVITSTQPTPLSLIGAGWEGRYVKRTQGI